MNRTSLRRAWVPTVAAIAAISLSACGAANEDSDGGSGEGLSGTLNGGGASSQEAAQTAWRAGFQTANGGATVNYDPVGSTGGREGFLDGGFAFAGTDSYLSDEEVAQAKETCGTDPIEVPAYVSPIAVIYNLEGIDDLKLSPQVIGDIFNAKITTWNDPQIAALNEGVDLPDATINAVHRSDGSGTTKNFTNYLSNVAAENWPHGAIEDWPIQHGEGASGTSGVVAAVTDSPNSIGYADASQATELGQAEVQVGDGFVGPSATAAAKILEVSTRVEGRAATDMAIDLDYQTSDATAYPIVLTSYLVACQQYADAKTADLVKGYLTYVVDSAGQEAAAQNAGSAPLSSALADEALRHIAAISAK